MYINKNEIQINNKKSIVFLLISLFVFSQELRVGIIGNKFSNINILALVSLGVLVIKNFRKINKKKLMLLQLTILIYISTSMIYENKIITIINFIVAFIIPLILVIVEVDNNTIEYAFKITIIILNLIILIITIIGILEMIFHININPIISNFMSERTREQIIESSMSTQDKRLYSFMGHPLFNTELYLMFFILNNLYSKYIKKQQCPLWILAVAVVGIAFTGSKTGIILLCVSTITLFKCSNKLKKLLTIICGSFIALESGLLDTLMSRFTSGSLTTGRSEMWDEIQSLNLYPIKFFTGYGLGFTFTFNSYLTYASAAYEYPIRMFSLEIGMLTAIMIYIFLFAIPTIVLIRRKHIYIYICYLVIFLDVNTFNGLSTSGDKMLIFSFFIFLILNLSKLLKEEQLAKKSN
ncbi:hypothetical protein [Clostridium sp. OS1-26]|uniref:hypothetical protein n=1 Tax=Clostridium sp. OS1-26 TaxID=3070681 RepID=UPI0027E06EF2|nr:hypothetical protein [Clostridium sp. OS1-26]WML36800.1 hypothetical protein RCG18_09335 [Clostridium sp. OS1-26]